MDRTRCPGPRFSMQLRMSTKRNAEIAAPARRPAAFIATSVLSTTETLTGRNQRADYQSEYFVPSSAVASEPLLTSYTPGGALGLVGSGSLGVVCHVDELIVNGSSGTFR